MTKPKKKRGVTAVARYKNALWWILNECCALSTAANIAAIKDRAQAALRCGPYTPRRKEASRAR